MTTLYCRRCDHAIHWHSGWRDLDPGRCEFSAPVVAGTPDYRCDCTEFRRRRLAMDASPGRWLLWNDSAFSNVATQLRKLGYEVKFRTLDHGDRRKGAIYARRPEGWKP